MSREKEDEEPPVTTPDDGCCREKGNGFQAGRFFGKNEQGDGKLRAGRREMRENEQGEGR